MQSSFWRGFSRWARRKQKGTYVWKDAQTACFIVTDPPPKPGEKAFSNCRPFPVTHHVGDVWTEKDSEGVPYTNTIIAGWNSCDCVLISTLFVCGS